jgi:exodeoxyribonuclease-5
MTDPTPNTEQQLAIAAMLAHLRTTGNRPFLVLKGPAGTGKTFTMGFVVREFKRSIVFTAPTNKAVRVLREALTSDQYKPYCRTIYSLLGLQMQANGEVKELAKPEDPIDLNEYAAIVVDEAGMLGEGKDHTGIWKYILEAAEKFPRIKWIFMGDPYQLPPVGEVTSPVWLLPEPVELVKVMRQDNQILTLATHLRGMVEKPFAQLKLASDNDGEEGVWRCDGSGLETAILNHSDTFLKGESKAIAWRNVTVDKFNSMIRRELFADPLVYPWQPGDRITLLEPAKNLDGDIIGTTDEEGAVEKADRAPHPIHDLDCWRIVMRSDMNTSLTLWVLADTAKGKFELRKARLAAEARADRSKWKEFWAYVESFHKVRHAYAITAHRAQGSTYKRAFVSWRDILANPNRAEALRCLYVAATRPKKELYLG